MLKLLRFIQVPVWVFGLAAGAALSMPAVAASSVAAEKAHYQRERARCMQHRDHGQRADCLSEASTAHVAAMPPVPDADPGRYARNAVERCKALQEPDRGDCMQRMQGRGTTSGSVSGGGIYRELVTVVPGEAPATR
jgi:hypothetical protein